MEVDWSEPEGLAVGMRDQVDWSEPEGLAVGMKDQVDWSEPGGLAVGRRNQVDWSEPEGPQMQTPHGDKRFSIRSCLAVAIKPPRAYTRLLIIITLGGTTTTPIK